MVVESGNKWVALSLSLSWIVNKVIFYDELRSINGQFLNVALRELMFVPGGDFVNSGTELCFYTIRTGLIDFSLLMNGSEIEFCLNYHQNYENLPYMLDSSILTDKHGEKSS